MERLSRGSAGRGKMTFFCPPTARTPMLARNVFFTFLGLFLGGSRPPKNAKKRPADPKTCRFPEIPRKCQKWQFLGVYLITPLHLSQTDLSGSIRKRPFFDDFLPGSFSRFFTFFRVFLVVFAFSMVGRFHRVACGFGQIWVRP